MANTRYGANYERTKDLRRVELKKEIAATIKKELAKGGELYKTLTLPERLLLPARGEDSSGHPLTPAEVKRIKVTLKETGGRTCSSTTATIRGFPDVLNEYAIGVTERRVNLDVDDQPRRYTPRASAFLKAVEALIRTFNFDGSDLMTDYFHVRFYLHVQFDRDEEDAQREEIVRRCSPLRAKGMDLLKPMHAVLSDWCVDNGYKPPSCPTFNAAGTFLGGYFEKMLAKAFDLDLVQRLKADLREVEQQINAADDWTDVPQPPPPFPTDKPRQTNRNQPDKPTQPYEFQPDL